ITSPRCGAPVGITSVLLTGSRRPYEYLLTKMKSPSNRVGIIESEGMRNGSNKNDRITNTNTMTGKNERAYSTATGSRTRSGGVPADAAARLRVRAKNTWLRRWLRIV